MNISVLGDGAWGSAVANLLYQNKQNVKLWGPFSDYIEEMNRTRINSRFLPSYSFPEEIELTSDLSVAVKNADILIFALPTQYQRELIIKLKNLYKKNQIIINIAKGIENESLERLSELTAEILGDVKYAVLSGPSHAEEVIKGSPTAVVVGCKDEKIGKIIQSIFINDFFRVYYSSDTVGVELGGALKNVFAIAAGIADGMKLGDNSKAALVTRSIAEMSRLGKALNGKYETFSGLSGIGDMIVTCFSKHSRNRHVGEKLGQGYTLEQILKEMGMVVAEGVKTTKSAYKLAEKINIEVPIINELYSTLYADKTPYDCIKDLMSRSAKPEIY
ncbi:MAG TPA: NAD(P)H-dependent glycerol-3-phosphate dehydrogenase [Victivallales bacterium]|nr:NAD(P)H-dependent glycerol-3-phosphate dehydrogenase [Victivallales bacterium]